MYTVWSVCICVQWVFVQLNPDVDCEFGKLLTLSDQYFRTMHEGEWQCLACLDSVLALVCRYECVMRIFVLLFLFVLVCLALSLCSLGFDPPSLCKAPSCCGCCSLMESVGAHEE